MFYVVDDNFNLKLFRSAILRFTKERYRRSTKTGRHRTSLRSDWPTLPHCCIAALVRTFGKIVLCGGLFFFAHKIIAVPKLTIKII